MDPSSPFIQSVLRKPGVVALPGNSAYLKDFAGTGGRVVQQPSGHLVFYGVGNRRILMTDPDGHPLHECEWGLDSHGLPKFVAARLQLEWGEWVGIRPDGLVNSTSLNLSTRPGWERLTRDDLRVMAAGALNVSFDQIRFFYSDQDLILDPSGQATIFQRKDAFYVLHEGRFESAKFMSCMSRMHWERIDYLPVVELFLSLLPGTGSATFELIRGLYDDQNLNNPLPLHYRGIPVYPSEGAFRLFSQFFSASLPGSSEDPLSVFLDPARSEEVIWLPSVDPPLRYFDPEKQLCITMRKGGIQKATLADDPSGLSYFRSSSRMAPFGQSVTVDGSDLVLFNGHTTRKLSIPPSWQIPSQQEPNQSSKSFPTWHQFFPEGAPHLNPIEAFSSTLLYPDDQTVIGEIESQPFAMDFFDDLIDENPDLKAHMTSANQVLFSQCDAAVGSCLRFDRQRNLTILYHSEPFAQKQAQNLWNKLAQRQKLNWIDSISFLPHSKYWQTCLNQSYDVVFLWVPFDHFENKGILSRAADEIHRLLLPQGLAFVVGPPPLAECSTLYQLGLMYGAYVNELPTFHLHQAILPKARLQPDLMVFVLRKDR